MNAATQDAYAAALRPVAAAECRRMGGKPGRLPADGPKPEDARRAAERRGRVDQLAAIVMANPGISRSSLAAALGLRITGTADLLETASRSGMVHSRRTTGPLVGYWPGAAQ